MISRALQLFRFLATSPVRFYTFLKRCAKGVLYDGNGTLSLSRVVVVFVFLNVFAILWLGVAWIWFVTKHGLMEQAAPLASAVFSGVAAVLSSGVAIAGWQYFTQMKHGAGGITREEIAEQDAAPPPVDAQQEQSPGGI